jgi:hypothetical protein
MNKLSKRIFLFVLLVFCIAGNAQANTYKFDTNDG